MTLFSHQVFDGRDFSGQNLSKLKVERAVFKSCNFDDADMSESDFEHCDFTGSSFRRTNCFYTSFKRSLLAATEFAPSNAFGMTMTFHCKTFENMSLSQNWWYYWLMLIASTNPGSGPVEGPLKDQLIAAIGADRYVKLKQIMCRREL